MRWCSLVIYVLFGFFDGRERAAARRRSTRSRRRPNQRAARAAAADQPARGPGRDARAREDELLITYGWVDRNAGIVRIPIDGGDEADAGARAARAAESEHDDDTQRHRGARANSPRVLCLCILCVLCGFRREACTLRWPVARASAGLQAGSGHVSSSAMPKALQSIGFDQNIDQRVPLDTVFRDESGATVRLGDYFGRQPGRPRVRLLRLPDAVHAGDQRPVERAGRDVARIPGKDFEIVTVSFNPRDTPASAAAKKAVYLERYKRPRRRQSWHFLTGDQPSDRAPHARPPASATPGTRTPSSSRTRAASSC